MQKKKKISLRNIKENKSYIFLFIIIFTLCLIILKSSPLYKGLPEIDSSVFQVMGKGLMENKVIYKDLFDHKGPIVYIINALALLISNKFGLFVVEVILFYIGTIFVYKTARIVLSEKMSIVICLLYIVISFRYFDGGNYTEEYAITFMNIALYYIIKILYQKQDSKKIYWIIIGATFTVNVLIKPTYISIWIAFGLVQLISSIKDKKVKELIKNIRYILIGILVISIPIIIYLIINNDINNFIDAYIDINMKYSNSSILRRIKNFKVLTQYYEYNIYLIITVISNIIILFNKNSINKRTKSFITLFIIFSIILTIWAPNAFMHYLIQLAPCVIIECIFVAYLIEKKIKEKNILEYKIIKDLPLNFLYIVVVFVILLNIGQTLKGRQGLFSKIMEKEESIINNTKEIVDYIDEDDDILVLGNNSYYYLLFNKQPKFKYFFQYPIIKYDEKIREETERYIIEEKPKIIIDEKYKNNEIYGNDTFESVYGERIVEELIKNYEEHDIKIIKYYVLRGEV